MGTLKLYLFVFLILGALGSGTAYYYKQTQAKIERLTSNNATLKTNLTTVQSANEQNIEQIRSLQESYKEVQQQYEQANADLAQIQARTNQLKERLGDHNIAYLAEAKPKPVEKILNGASDKAFRCFELLSGAPLTDNEKEAENDQKFNSECPWLFEELVGNTTTPNTE
jgi:uncharacterized protein HemX